MAVKNCKYCNKIFNYNKGACLCNKCDDELFNKVKTFLNENTNATLSEISEATKIPIRVIREYINDERIIEVRHDQVKLCAKCGDAVSGDSKYCIACLKKIKTAMELENSFNNSKKTK